MERVGHTQERSQALYMYVTCGIFTPVTRGLNHCAAGEEKTRFKIVGRGFADFITSCIICAGEDPPVRLDLLGEHAQLFICKSTS